MTINCIDERVKILKKLWNREQDPRTMDILLKQLKSDIIFFCSEKMPEDLQIQIDELTEEVHEYGNNQ